MSKYNKEIEFLTKQISGLTIEDNSQNPTTIKIYGSGKKCVEK